MGAPNIAPKHKKLKIIIPVVVIPLFVGGVVFSYIRDFGPIGHALHSLVDMVKSTSLVANLDDDTTPLESDEASAAPGSDTSKKSSRSKPVTNTAPSRSSSKPKSRPPSSPTRTPSFNPSPTPAPGPRAPNCAVNPAHRNLQDQAEAIQKDAWRRTIPYKVSIYYETRNVPANIKALMESAANQWNKSPCLDLHVVKRCPSNVNCVTSKMGGTPPKKTNLGRTGVATRGGYIVRAEITYYDGYRENTISHEMGHSLGLMHRRSPQALLHPTPSATVPDAIDFKNLLVLYGSK